jgi:hypothetical protein
MLTIPNQRHGRNTYKEDNFSVFESRAKPSLDAYAGLRN